MFKLKYWCKLWPTDTCNVNKFLHKDKFINLLGTSRWYYIEIQGHLVYTVNSRPVKTRKGKKENKQGSNK